MEIGPTVQPKGPGTVLQQYVPYSSKMKDRLGPEAGLGFRRFPDSPSYTPTHKSGKNECRLYLNTVGRNFLSIHQKESLWMLWTVPVLPFGRNFFFSRDPKNRPCFSPSHEKNGVFLRFTSQAGGGMYVCGYMHVLQSYETAAAQRLGAYVRLCVLYSMCVYVFKYVMLRSLSAEKGNDRFHCPNLQQQSSFDVLKMALLYPGT